MLRRLRLRLPAAAVRLRWARAWIERLVQGSALIRLPTAT
jgi:hypothetical protein